MEGREIPPVLQTVSLGRTGNDEEDFTVNSESVSRLSMFSSLVMILQICTPGNLQGKSALSVQVIAGRVLINTHISRSSQFPRIPEVRAAGGQHF